MKMRTITGRHFDPTEIEPSDIDLLDIAHALSRLCRYAGHVPGFYSVAQHSVYVSKMLERRNPDDVELQLLGLLHDASEAYLGDVIRPLKLALPDYQAIEANVEFAIGERFDLVVTDANRMEVKYCDDEMITVEAIIFRDFNDGWRPDRAKHEFTSRYFDLVKIRD